MIIPKKIKVGGHSVRVVFSDKIPHSGEWDATNNTITINSTFSRSVQESTFIHELFHVMNSEFGGDTPTHIILDSFAEQLYQILKDNNLLR